MFRQEATTCSEESEFNVSKRESDIARLSLEVMYKWLKMFRDDKDFFKWAHVFINHDEFIMWVRLGIRYTNDKNNMCEIKSTKNDIVINIWFYNFFYCIKKSVKKLNINIEESDLKDFHKALIKTYNRVIHIV